MFAGDCLLKCDPGGIRTHNLQNRNLLFYPIELRSQSCKKKKVESEGVEPSSKQGITKLSTCLFVN